MLARFAPCGLIWMLAACGTPPRGLTPEQIDVICHRSGGPLPDELYGEDWSVGSPDSSVAASQKTQTTLVLDLPARAGHVRLAINPHAPEYRAHVSPVCIPPGELVFGRVRVCVTELGTVSKVKILQPSVPIVDAQLPEVMERWRYHPYLVDGPPTPFCYNMNYRVR